MKHKISILILFLFLQIVCFSQNIDSLIISRPANENELINIARDLLLQEILSYSPDIQKIIDIQEYINANYYLGLSDDENLMLYYYTQNWDKALMQIIAFNHGLINDNPPNAVRNLFFILYRKIEETKKIDFCKSNLSQELIDFLILYYNCKILRIEIRNRKESVNKSNYLIKKFKKDYPNSSYLQYLVVF